jgi:hypothetical protein
MGAERWDSYAKLTPPRLLEVGQFGMDVGC